MTTNTAHEQIRHDWSLPEIQALFELPFNDLLFLAQSIHRQNFDPNALQVSDSPVTETGSGGIPGIGKSREDRAVLLMELANLPMHPESVPINLLIRISGTPLADEEDLGSFEFVRTVAVARIMMPRSWVRLSAGRESMNDQMQALCYFAGANSVFCGDKLLTTGNKAVSDDTSLFERLGLNTVDTQVPAEELNHDMEVLAELKRSAENELFFNAMD